MKELENIAPKLSKIKKEQPFAVPGDYFDHFPVHLQNKLDAERRVPPKAGKRLMFYLKPAIGLAASFILILLLVWWPIKSFLPGYMAKNLPPADTLMLEEDRYISLIEKLDENSFLSLIGDSTEEEELDNDDLMNYLTANISDYEIFLETHNE